MKHISTFTIALPLLTFMPACDSPDDEAELQALDLEDDPRQAQEDAQGAHLERDITADPKPSAAGCHFKVIWPAAGVYEQPASGLLKTKHSGDIVGNWCFTASANGYLWQAVTSASAEDDIGWMRSDALKPI